MSTIYSLAAHPLALTLAAALAAVLVYAIMWPHGWKRDAEGVCPRCGERDVFRHVRRDGATEIYHAGCGALSVMRLEVEP